jgi:hypothetical protein
MSAQEILDAPAKVAEYKAVDAGLAELKTKYAKTVFDVTTTAGDKAARAARQECVKLRTSVEAIRKEIKAPMLEKIALLDGEAKRITAEVKAVEAPIDEQITAEETRKAEIKAAKEAADLARQKAVQERIDHIRDFATEAVGLGSVKIGLMRDTLGEFPLTPELYEQRTGEAMQVHAEIMNKLEQLHGAALEHEQEQARVVAERAEVERQRLEQEAVAAEARKAEDARIAAERAKLAQEQAALKAAQDAENARQDAARKEQARTEAEAAAALRKQQEEAAAAAQKQQDEAAAKLRAQQAEIDRQRQAFEAEQAAARKAEQDRLGAIAREEQEKAEAVARAAREKEAAERAVAEKAEQDRLAEAARREQEQFEVNGPGNVEIVRVLADHYDVEPECVLTWLAKFTNPDMAELAE